MWSAPNASSYIPAEVTCVAPHFVMLLFFEEIFEALKRGEPVKLKSFGSFHVRSKQARVGRNPKTGREAPIAPRKVLMFRASPVLAFRINGTTIADGDE